MAKKKRPKPGKPAVVPGEHTERITVNLNETLYARATVRAGDGGMSAYIRRLVERDVARAS